MEKPCKANFNMDLQCNGIAAQQYYNCDIDQHGILYEFFNASWVKKPINESMRSISMT